MVRNDYIPFPSEILEVIKHTDIEYTFRMAFRGDVKPGQFFEVSIPKYGEAPISVSGIGEGFVDLTIRRVGKVTYEVFEHYVGDTLLMRGPYGNGTVYITGRQGFEIPGIPFDKTDEVKAALQSIIEGLEINQEAENEGYPAAGTRNITACIGNRVCPYACYDTTAFAKRIEKAVFPNDRHFKVALTGCPNDCGKVRMHDFGIMGMTEPQLDPNRCVSCGGLSYAVKTAIENSGKNIPLRIVTISPDGKIIR